MAAHETAPLLINDDRDDEFDEGRSRNVIMMVSDGFGPASQTYARNYYQYVSKEDYVSPLDKILVGSVRTESSDSYITDSAAAATAYSCGLKTYNGAVGVDPNGVPCGTILEAAKDRGMLTGMVVTSRVTDATPAAFSAHVPNRFMESEIAEQQIGDYVLGRQIDLLLGGGRCFFLPNTTEGSCRQDGRDLIRESKDYNWKNVILNKARFEELNDEDEGIPLPALGLFHQTDLSFEIDRDPTKEPSLLNMTMAALKSLRNQKGPNQGFFLLIEGSRIDMAAHVHDPVAHLHEILQYQETVAAVRKFVAENTDTLLISTSDHETGGFTLGFQEDPKVYPEYLWNPDVIQRAKASTEILTAKLLAYAGQGKDRHHFVKTVILEEGLGITDPTKEELSFLSDSAPSPQDILLFLGHAISRRAKLGWTTMGHTGVDVNLYADGDGNGVKGLRGNHENIDIGEAMSTFLHVDLGYITRKLEKEVSRWFKPKRRFSGVKFGPSQHEKIGL
ncbi:hypothetical protein BGX27_009638 [Mortierella sp. AM989]|nr:hypothetical protein BGX27_009638 [Mortierella sp. AM989]